MISLKKLLHEVVDGHGYFTKEKFGSIILSELKKVFPRYAEIELSESFDFQTHKDKTISNRSTIHNSSLMAIFNINYNDYDYEVRITNTFKKVPDDELTNKFTMADDEFLKKLSYGQMD